ncbi:mannan endo-1,6-alpha-mannosidase [Tothia fuscella]|uniref:Mannan endo-1,6-alpha-mannosidase n=1 Tax=Tothia fuscella TaxID=1048955 RepID=A0A9P4NPS8_9PEZI|nr:mannan endo-1,6-alpha-mannosidase [Tothia fuscella]
MLFFLSRIITVVLRCLVLNRIVLAAIPLDIDDSQSVRFAASLVARGIQSLYQPNATNGIVGKWPYPPYFWWESGGAWGAMIEYWHYTNDTTYNSITYQALTHQLSLEAFNTGNDDRAFWVVVAMSAAEYNFREPVAPLPSWLQVVINAWEVFAHRWVIDSSTCGGGLRWQFQENMAGWNYKNAISNSLFFQISARLARFTGNDTYLEFSHQIWAWTTSIGMIDDMYNVYDGSDVLLNCSKLDHHQWTYNVGAFLYGAAVLANYTNSSTAWVQRTAGLLEAIGTFAYCELPTPNTCNLDQLSMKAYLARWLAGTTLVAPFTAAQVGAILRTSASGAAAACDSTGQICGSKWYLNGSDGTTGLGQQLAVLEIMYALLVNQTAPPATQPQVQIGLQAANITDILRTVTATLPSTSGTARPLFDGPKGASHSLTAGKEILDRLGRLSIPFLTCLMNLY